jgi:mannose/fructose-specific phosphotransferase system component IIA
MSSSEQSPTARAVVAGHGDFASGMISAVGQITGRAELFVGISNRDVGADDLATRIREAIGRGARVIFTDLPAGSCTIAARRVLREQPGATLVTGANLAALLDFVFQGDEGAQVGAERAADKGRASITVVGGGGGR